VCRLAIGAFVDVGDREGNGLARRTVEGALVGDGLLDGQIGLQDGGGVRHLAVDVEHLAELGFQRLQAVAAELGCGVDAVNRDAGHRLLPP
jgi:hypothetical protein